jgi:L-arabinose isomerase
MRLQRKIIVGFRQDVEVHAEIGAWVRAACALARCATAKGRSRFGDNMRNVVVTEGIRSMRRSS